MKRLMMTAAALALLTTAAQAKPHTLFKGTYWQTFGMASNDDGQPMCGMRTGGDVTRLYIKWTPQNGMKVQVWKSNWRLAEGTEVPFVLGFFDGAKPGDNITLSTDGGLAEPTEGGIGTSVFMTVSNENMAKLLKVFGDADRMTVNFPQGDEPQWNAKMEGSRKAADEFMHCMYVVQQNIPTSPVKPTQPTGKTTPKANVKDNGGI